MSDILDLDSAIDSAFFMKKLYEEKYNRVLTEHLLEHMTLPKVKEAKASIKSNTLRSVLERTYRS